MPSSRAICSTISIPKKPNSSLSVRHLPRRDRLPGPPALPRSTRLSGARHLQRRARVSARESPLPSAYHDEGRARGRQRKITPPGARIPAIPFAPETAPALSHIIDDSQRDRGPNHRSPQPPPAKWCWNTCVCSGPGFGLRPRRGLNSTRDDAHRSRGSRPAPHGECRGAFPTPPQRHRGVLDIRREQRPSGAAIRLFHAVLSAPPIRKVRVLPPVG